jgi:predicted lipid-binding transport protein (Tim44 family)
VRLVGLFAALLTVFSMAAIETAEARMGGSFGSRGLRTFQSVPSTTTAPRITGPVQRSMTPSNVNPGLGVPQTQFNQPRPGGLFGGLMGGFGGLMSGLFLGGLFGMMLGHGFGGAAGGFGFLFQLLLIGGVLYFVTRMFRSRQAPAVAPTGGFGGNNSPFRMPDFGGRGYGSPSGPANRDELGIGNNTNDLATFERILQQVQDAFAREDYVGLRRLTTPEMVSYLSEELSQNATNGVKNDVTDLKFLQGDVAESWREGNKEYATVAMRYSAKDVMRDRKDGKLVKGDAEKPVETTEVWTFVRENGGDWQLSAIQET